MSKIQYIKKYPSKVRKMVKGEVDGKPAYVPKRITNPIFKKRFNQKIGILFAETCGDDVIIGFSLCHSKEDKFDQVKKVTFTDDGTLIKVVESPGLGVKIAKERAKKWKDRIGFRIYGSPDIDWGDYHGVPIPHTVSKPLLAFITDCKKFYKLENQKLVPWAEDFLTSHS